MTWRDDIRPASWRGEKFGVTATETRVGRRVAIHEYPFRDTVWVEDLGRGVRRLNLIGFIVGDDAIARKEAMMAAAEEEGPGELVHPTLGSRQVALVEFSSAERWDHGRVIELTFGFVETEGQGLAAFPLVGGALGELVGQAADAADLSAAASFARQVGATVQQGAAVARQVARTITSYTSAVTRAVSDATRAVHAVGGLVPGTGASFGRYASGSRSALNTVLGPANTVAGALSRASDAQRTVQRSVTTLSGLLGGL